jgi:hypothetical protein
MTGPARYLFAGLVGACVLLGIVLVAMTPARGHDWYPMECCSSQDCAPIDKVEQVPTSMASMFSVVPGKAMPSVMVVTTKHGTVMVPPNFPERVSKDGRAHACIRGNKLLCLFVPPSS